MEMNSRCITTGNGEDVGLPFTEIYINICKGETIPPSSSSLNADTSPHQNSEFPQHQSYWDKLSSLDIETFSSTSQQQSKHAGFKDDVGEIDQRNPTGHTRKTYGSDDNTELEKKREFLSVTTTTNSNNMEQKNEGVNSFSYNEEEDQESQDISASGKKRPNDGDTDSSQEQEYIETVIYAIDLNEHKKTGVYSASGHSDGTSTRSKETTIPEKDNSSVEQKQSKRDLPKSTDSSKYEEIENIQDEVVKRPADSVDQLINQHCQSLIETSKSAANRIRSLLQTNKALLAEVSKLKLENAQLKKAACPERSTPSTIGTSATSHQDYTHSSITPHSTKPTIKNFAIILLDRDNEISSLKQALTDTTRHHESFVRRAEKRMASEREAMLSEIHILKDRLRKAEDTSDDYKQKIIDVLQASHSTREIENRKLKREIKILKNRKKFKSPVGKEKEEYDMFEQSE